MVDRSTNPNRGLLVVLVIVPVIAVAAFVAWSYWGRTDEVPQTPFDASPAGKQATAPAVNAIPPQQNRPTGPDTSTPKPAPDVAAPLVPSPAETNSTAWRLIGKCTTPTYDDGKEPRPIPGVRVTISAADATKTNWFVFPAAVSDADGRFTIDFEPLKKRFPVYRWQIEWHFEAVKDGMVLFALPDHDLPPPPNDDGAGYQPRLHVQLEKGAVITVAVRDPTGALARDAELYDDVGHVLSTTTGHFSITREAKGPVRIAAWSNDGVSAAATVDVTEFRHYALPDLHLRPGHTIEGFAHYADGSPARFVALYGDVDADDDGEIGIDDERPEALPTTRDSFQVRTDRNGRFVVAGLADAPYEISADMESIIGHGSPDLRCRPGRGLVKFPLRYPRLIVQTFIAGKPCPGVPVSILSWSAARADAVERQLATGSLTPEQVEVLKRDAMASMMPVTETTDAVRGVAAPPGSLWLLQIRALGVTPITRLLRFPTDQNELMVALHAERLPAPSTLRLDVRDDAGQPFEAMRLTLRPIDGLSPINGVGAEQRATGDRIEGLAPGRYEVGVDVPQSWFQLEGLSFFERLERVVELAPGENKIEGRLGALGVIDISLS